MPRNAVSLEELFTLLEREFRKVRAPECKTCVTPYPIRRSPADEVSSNWFITEPEPCAHHCATRLGEIATRMMSEYELERTVYSAKVRRPSRTG